MDVNHEVTGPAGLEGAVYMGSLITRMELTQWDLGKALTISACTKRAGQAVCGQ